jgi:SAM-dependent methyltransferase
MPFGSERAHVSSSAIRATYYRLYGAARAGDKIRAWHVLPKIYASLRPGAHLLDAGCSMGSYSVHLAQRFPGIRIQAIDIDNGHLASLTTVVDKLGLSNLSVRQCNLVNLDPEPRFHCVLCIDVLEHIEADDKAVERIARSLVPGGMLFVHVPQRDQLHFLPQPADFHAWDHVREGYSLSELSSVLTQAGLEVISHRHTFGFCGALASDLDEYLQHIKPVWMIMTPLILLLARLDVLVPDSRGNGLLVTARKPAEPSAP